MKRLRAKVLAMVVAGLTGAAAPNGSAVREAAAQEGAAGAAAAERMYRGPGLRAFRLGHRAWELHDWDTVLSQMSEALNADPDQPDAQVRLSGVFWSPYIPRYYHSHAQCQLRQCEQARGEMDEVLRLIKDAPSYLRNRYQKDCQKACPSVAPAEPEGFTDNREADPSGPGDRPPAPEPSAAGREAVPDRHPGRLR